MEVVPQKTQLLPAAWMDAFYLCPDSIQDTKKDKYEGTRLPLTLLHSTSSPVAASATAAANFGPKDICLNLG